MRDNTDGICVAYPYVFPQDTDLPIDRSIKAHCTLIYLGYTDEVDFTPEDVFEPLSGMEFSDTGIVDVDGLELFGDNHDILVMLLKSSALMENYEKVSGALGSKGIKSASSFAEYRPHITLNEDYHGPTIGYTLPTTVGLARPMLWWGDDWRDI